MRTPRGATPVQRIEGIVLKATPSRDADLILHVLTPDKGKLSVIAKYARKTKKQFATTLEILDRGWFELRRNKGHLPSLSSFSPRSSFKAIRESLDRITVASLVCEIFDVFTHDEVTEHAQENFEIADLTLRAIAEAHEPKEMLRSAYLGLAQFLSLCGYVDSSQLGAPSAKRFLTLLHSIQPHAERKLWSKVECVRLIERVSNDARQKVA